MKKKEKRNLLILVVVAIVLIALEVCYTSNCNAWTGSDLITNEKLAGISDVSGQGIIIDITDGKDLIHQEDVVILLDELKNAGAEAISVNGQRIVTNTYIYCDGSVILIDGVKIGNPFQIKAIGNSEVIYGAMTRNKGYIDTLKGDGLTVEVSKSDNVEIQKTNKELSNNLVDTASESKKIAIIDRLIGKTDVIGSGIEITIDTSNTSDITALTLLQLINDLNSAGVQAVSVNGCRIVNMTDIMDINKEYILVDSTCVNSPYVIKAIGNVEKLEKVVNLENSTVSKLRKNGKNIEINSKWYLKIDKYSTLRGQNKLNVNYMK